MKKLLILLLLVGCMEVDEVSDSGDYVEKSFSSEYCGGSSRKEVYDYIQGSVERDGVTMEYFCEYDDWDRLTKVEIYDYLQGVPDKDFQIGETLYIWGVNNVVILKKDYLQGSPEDDYLIGRDVCYW